jgi:hypothetical protein
MIKKYLQLNNLDSTVTLKIINKLLTDNYLNIPPNGPYLRKQFALKPRGPRPSEPFPLNPYPGIAP